MPVSEAVKLERAKMKAAREARAWEREKIIWDRFATPENIRLAAIMAIIAYSTYCARSKHNVGPVQSALAFALPGIGIPVLAAEAGISDKYALAAISAAGIAYTGLQSVQGWSEAGVLGDVTVLPGASIKSVGRFMGELGAAPTASLAALMSALHLG